MIIDKINLNLFLLSFTEQKKIGLCLIIMLQRTFFHNNKCIFKLIRSTNKFK